LFAALTITQAFLTPVATSAEKQRIFVIIVGGLEELSDEHIRMLVSEHRMCRQLLQFLEAPTIAVEFLAQDP